jgi:hypothetical protein
MASARGDALDWALALARAPGERFALRQQPLPAGMEAVLQIAGGNHADALEAAAAHAGMTPAEVVEVARFYVREMLFFPDADPYRVLGLAADASDEQVKHHHRLLQQWLHPDRPTSDWDAAFAARVNAAWSQLRTPAKREAYAATVAAAPAPTVPPADTDSVPSWSPPARIHAHAPDAGYAQPALDEGRWRRRAPVLALFGVCAVLGVLAVRDMQREPDTGLTGTEAAGIEVAEEAQAVALQLPAATPPSDTVAKPAPPKRATPAPAPRNTPIAVAAKPIPKPAAEPVAKPAPRPAATPAAVAVASKPVPKPLPKPIAKPIAKPLAPPVTIAAAPKSVAAKPVAAAVVPSPTRRPPVVVAAATPNVAATAPKAPSATPKVTTALAAAPPKPAVKPAAKPAPAPGANPALAAVAKPVRKPPITSALVAQPAPEPKPPVAAAPVAVATAAAPAAAPNSPTQVAQAQQTGQRLLAYVSGRGGGMPPIWANLSAQKQASAARGALQGSGRVAVGSPDWQVGGSTAAMQASLTPRDGSARRLRVDMVWREQRWLVTGLALEQMP